MRTLVFNYCANPKTNNRRAYQIGLRILHNAMVWFTHVFVKSTHDVDMIDGSHWPIDMQGFNMEMTIIQNVLKGEGGIDNGHQINPRMKHIIHPGFLGELNGDAAGGGGWFGGGAGGGKKPEDMTVGYGAHYDIDISDEAYAKRM